MPAIRIRAIKAHMEVTGISGAESKSAMGAVSNRYARNSIHSTTRITPFRLVGGKENIAAVSHCMTRMRFALADPEKADVKAIEALKSVKGSFTQSGQFQVIIGNTVADFYNEFVKTAGIEGVSKDAVKNAAKKNQNLLQRFIAAMAEIFAPLIPAIITGGLILGFRNCIDSLYLFENGTKTLCDLSQFWAGIDSFLWLIGEAIFHMFPVGICWSVTKKMERLRCLALCWG